MTVELQGLHEGPETRLAAQAGVTPPVIDRPFTDADVPALLAYLRRI